MRKSLGYMALLLIGIFVLMLAVEGPASAKRDKKEKKDVELEGAAKKDKKEDDPYYVPPYKRYTSERKPRFRRGKFRTKNYKEGELSRQEMDLQLSENADNYLIYQEVNSHLPKEFPFKLKWWFYVKNLDPSKVWVLDKYIFAMTVHDVLYCIDKKTGLPIWAMAFESPIVGAPSVLPSKADDKGGFVYCITKSRLYKIDLREGDVEYWQPIPFIPASGALITENGIYIGGMDNNLYCYDPEDGLVLWLYNCFDVVSSVPAITKPQKEALSIYVGAEDNALHGITLDRKKKQLDWDIATRGPIVSRPLWYHGYAIKKPGVEKPVPIPPMIYVCSRDYNIYGVDLNRSKVGWQYAADKPLSTTPVCDIKNVFVKEDKGDLLVLDRLEGTFQWRVKGGLKIAYVDPKYYYVWANNTELVRVQRNAPEEKQRAVYNLKGFVAALGCEDYYGHLEWDSELMEIEPGKFDRKTLRAEKLYLIYGKGVICGLEPTETYKEEK